MSSNCSVIAIIHPSNKALIEETLGELPKDVHLVKLETALAGFPGVLDLLVASMKITETTMPIKAAPMAVNAAPVQSQRDSCDRATPCILAAPASASMG